MEAFSEKQIQLLQAADEVIAIKGYNHTTIRDISKNAGANIALISYYFGSKEGMMHSLLRYKCEELEAHFSRLSATIQGGIPPMQLRELIRHCIRHLFKILHLRKAIIQDFEKYIPIEEHLRSCLILLTEHIDILIKRGVGMGYFTFVQKAEDLVSIMVGSIFFAFEQASFYADYIPHNNENEYLEEAERRIGVIVAFSIFSSLGMSDEK